MTSSGDGGTRLPFASRPRASSVYDHASSASTKPMALPDSSQCMAEYERSFNPCKGGGGVTQASSRVLIAQSRYL